MTVIDYLSDEAEEEHTGTSWRDVVTRVFASTNDGEYILWFYCEYTGTTKGRGVAVRITIDGSEIAFDHFVPEIANRYRAFTAIGNLNLSAGSYTMKLQAVCDDAMQTVKIRRKRLVLMKH